MNRPLLVFAFSPPASAALVAQQASQSGPYQGVSNPPPDDSITSSEITEPIAKPPAGHPYSAQPATPARNANVPVPSQPAQSSTTPHPATGAVTGTDDGIVQVAQPEPSSA